MAATGYLTVRTYTSNAQLPIEGAAISVTQPTENGTHLIATRITDESGRITPIPILTPDRSESLTPGNSHPWTSVDITADHPNYDRVLVENVQIFANIITQQNLELLPRSELPEAYNMTEVIDITGQPL